MNRTQKRMMIFLIPFIIFALLMVMFFNRLGKPTDIVVTTSMNKPLPAFSLPLLSDPNRVMTNDNLPKTPFLMNVWGSWCPTCKVEHPFLMELHAQGVPMVGMNYKDELADALGYLNQYKDPFLYSVQDLDGRYGLSLGLTGAPETFVVDGNGVVYKHITGEIHEGNWTASIKPCMDALANPQANQTQRTQACQ
ncbi:MULTISPECIES: DsbE family thiol:disulfide interchange protein [Moraxella]|uniref:Thiol:disulfide interchange protein n=2 Tax=Moraxella lacunata TaxID=477 RepID=A0A1B8PX00_MORLA|nr:MULTISPECIES: DsbE family thiol:disulfide interchange protein [Moraxella]MBE9578893.1 DsbE family thiol:disulfide interchange protein [Moraxella sp. K1664]MBE9588237.1 DsbE family thiol:disulfide interchange protein [Moraxella sp. K1630]MBE9590822.1 DsbE family thiol:disulfide interchange protein [Moraxella sp. K127]MBE9596389.1 DsbE family thiol:disulfide interchange protein [Moraxella sp. K2450]MDH9218742.1 DsbE family thiol:disulfide interchange protein [Moraxella lacunata]